MAEWSRPNWSKTARRIRVPLGFVFAILYFWLARPNWHFIAFGSIAIIPGLLIRALASGHVRKNESLAISGPYAYTRNPLYLGSLLIGVGFSIAARSWWVALALVVMFFAIYIPVIRDEETFLRQKFPGFEEYTRRVPRLLPRLTPARASGKDEGSNQDGQSEFSWDLYRKHSEYNALLGTLLMLAALIGKIMLLRTH